MSEFKMVDARRVKALDGFRLEIVFDDDTMGVIDLSEFVQLGEVTEPLRDQPSLPASSSRWACRPGPMAAMSIQAGYEWIWKLRERCA